LKRLLLLLIILIQTLSVVAQKQANYWYFGEYAGLNFGMGVPVPITNGALRTGEGCSSISSASGILQFYTDGSFVWDRENEVMPHGSGLLGNFSSTQSGVIVPKPASTTQFYVFTVDAYEDGLVDGLCYSRVDMTLNDGLGDVVTSEKNISLLPLTCEKITAVGHDDGISIWVITHQWGTDAFYAYKITTAGVDLNPVISHTGEALTGNMQQAKGYLKVSPDGTKIAMANNTAFSVGIFNFNHASGTVTHIVTDHNFVNPGGQDPGGPYGVEFSPNSSRLYISEWKANRKIYQYDLTSNDPTTILNSRLIVASVGQNSYTVGALQLGPDNRLYIARNDNSSNSFSPYLSRINSPNSLGSGCGFVDNAVNLGGRLSRYGLPPFIQSFFYLTADFYWDIPSCDGSAIHFFTSASDNPDSVKWDFGDPGSGAENKSTLLNPVHLYPTTGNYWVTLVVYLYGVAKTVFHIVIIYEQPEVYLGNDTTACFSTPFIVDAGPGFEGYLWQNGDTNQSIGATETGLYWCQVTGDGGCTDTDSINLTLSPVPVVSAGPDKSIPNGTATILEGTVSAGSGDFTIQWQPAIKLVDATILQPQTVLLSNTTLFTLTVTDNQGGCFESDETIVTISGGVLSCNPFADPAEICFGGQSQLQAMASGGSGEYTYQWTSNPGNFTSGISNPVVNPTVTTDYSVIVDDGFSQVNGNVTVTVHSLPVPNAGPDKTIPFGTSTTLQGSAVSGSGVYNYSWEPANKLVDPHLAMPTTILLDATTVYTLTVTDAQTGCVCSEPDNMEVTITGNALAVTPIAQPDTICSGETIQLFSQASGGAGNLFYNFTWTSQPPGFSSGEKDPTDQPLVNTVYTVVLDDGYKQVGGSVAVIVHPSPDVNIGQDATVCVFDTIPLDAGNDGCNYLWSNGSTEKILRVATIGIGFDMRTFWVTVTAPGGCFQTDYRTIIFDFAACNGIDDPVDENDFQIYPNPGNGTIQIENNAGLENCLLNITDIFGREIVKNQLIKFPGHGMNFNLDLGSYPPGLYLIRISADGKDLVAMKYLLKR
jgi:hypothetical protein